MKTPKTESKSKNFSDLNPKPLKKQILNNFFLFGVFNLLWFLLRTGKKPSRITYPCQQEALRNATFGLGSAIPLMSVSIILATIKSWFTYGRVVLVLFLTVSAVGTASIAYTINSHREISLQINSFDSESEDSSDIFIVNGRDVAHINDLIDLMGTQNLSFYQTATSGVNQGPDGLVAAIDVVLLKINCQWSKRGGTNTDMLKELIQAVLDHPEGFTGEIVVADNGQGRGSMDWENTNSEDQVQSAQDVVDFFRLDYQVSTYLWDDIKNDEVEEYSDGDMVDGYVVYDTADSETGIYVSYPKFETEFGTKVSFRDGIWNGTGYEKRLKIINLPILKSHSGFGVTATTKHYMGVQTQGLANGHDRIAMGGMGTLMAELGIPTLNILDAIWVNANPETSSSEGPGTSYTEATRVNILLAGIDPIALDYWAAKYILLQASEMIGYTDTYSLDPDSSVSSGLTEAFGIWLNRTQDEILSAGYNVTTDEQKINVYANSLNVTANPENTNKLWIYFGSIGGSLILIAVSVPLGVRFIKKR
ncbi:MAG: DUF362 domain-containing protein [Candidatus Heimdallarchaeota archaeon]|nr:DUF362 domain-containing protein [Candidatus Heimdallarchaeota archaeon]MCK5143761.1 DUF362 domain-containing protein [Candidatus Heimdallarchaeota archaeon]